MGAAHQAEGCSAKNYKNKAKGKLLSQNAAQLVGNLMFDFRLVTPGLGIPRLGTPPLPPWVGTPQAWDSPGLGTLLGLGPRAWNPWP